MHSVNESDLTPKTKIKLTTKQLHRFYPEK